MPDHKFFVLTAKVKIATNSGGGAEEYPLVSFDIRTAMNSIPEAVIVLATGVNLNSLPGPSPSKTYGLMKEGKINQDHYSRAEIYVKNEKTGEEQKVFDGFIIATPTQYINRVTSVVLRVRHWLCVLDLFPCISSAIHPASGGRYNVPILRQYLTDTYTGTPVYINETIRILTADKFSGGVNELTEDGLKKTLNAWVDFAEKPLEWLPDWVKNTVAGGTNSRLKSVTDFLPAGYSPKDIVKKLKGEVQEVPGSSSSKSPGLKVRAMESASSGGDLVQQMLTQVFTVSSPEAVQNNTLYSLLLHWGSLFSYAVVPRAEDALVIPFHPVFNPQRVGISVKDLDGVISVDSESGQFRPVSTVLVLPEASDAPKDPVTGAVVADEWTFADVYAGVATLDTPGTLLVAKAPGWISHTAASLTALQNSKETLKDIWTKNWDQVRRISSYLAKSILLEHQYKDAIASVTTPLRFDICAGSTVRFRVGQTGAFGTGNKEEDITYDGYVMGVRFTFDKMNSTALSQFSVGYARIAKDYEAMPAEGSTEKDDWDEMPFYEGEPFGFASWTEKDFDLLS